MSITNINHNHYTYTIPLPITCYMVAASCYISLPEIPLLEIYSV